MLLAAVSMLKNENENNTAFEANFILLDVTGANNSASTSTSSGSSDTSDKFGLFYN